MSGERDEEQDKLTQVKKSELARRSSGLVRRGLESLLAQDNLDTLRNTSKQPSGPPSEKKQSLWQREYLAEMMSEVRKHYPTHQLAPRLRSLTGAPPHPPNPPPLPPMPPSVVSESSQNDLRPKGTDNAQTLDAELEPTSEQEVLYLTEILGAGLEDAFVQAGMARMADKRAKAQKKHEQKILHFPPDKPLGTVYAFPSNSFLDEAWWSALFPGLELETVGLAQGDLAVPFDKKLGLEIGFQERNDKAGRAVDLTFLKQFCHEDLQGLWIRELDLDYVSPRDVINGMENIARLTDLEALRLSRSDVDSDAARYLENLTKLRALDLSFTFISDEGVRYLKCLTQLRNLNLNCTQVSNKGLTYLQGLTHLKRLRLQATAIGDDGLVYLQGLTHLKKLNLDFTAVSDDGLVYLQGLTQLGELNLRGTQVRDIGLAHLQGLTQLTHLYLSSSLVRNEGLAYLQGLTQLEQLDLALTAISDIGLVHLQDLTQLYDLDLENTQVSDDGLVYLQGLTQLVLLNLRGTNVTEKGISLLEQALPNCVVTY